MSLKSGHNEMLWRSSVLCTLPAFLMSLPNRLLASTFFFQYSLSLKSRFITRSGLTYFFLKAWNAFLLSSPRLDCSFLSSRFM